MTGPGARDAELLDSLVEQLLVTIGYGAATVAQTRLLACMPLPLHAPHSAD